MAGRVPSFFILVPGPWRRAGEVIDALAERGISAEPRREAAVADGLYVDVIEDADLAAGFAWGRDGALPADLLDAIGACRHAALIEVAQRLDECTPRLVTLGRALRDLGGVAVRMEGSGAASPWQPWLERLESLGPAGAYAAAVILVEDGDGFFTCGMQQFGRPDAEMTMEEPGAAIEWLDAFCVFQVVDHPVLATGHTFRPHGQTARRVLERWPDHRHHPDDGRHNTFGLWRFLPEGAVGLHAESPVLTIVPSLVAMLTAAARTKGAALTRAEVERLVDEAPAIAMAVSDAVALERSRGYADIEPRLAWEQWQIVRSTIRT